MKRPLRPDCGPAGVDAATVPGRIPAQLLVLAKEPLPGRVKTRLSPPLPPAQAALVAKAALLDTLDAVGSVPVVRRTLVLDGSPVGLTQPGIEVLPQCAGGLGERLGAAFTDAYAAYPLPMLLIGMDTPQVTARMLTEALLALLSPGVGSVLGPATDGGWWALGLHAPVAGLFDGVPMSTPRTGFVQQQRLREAGLSPVTLTVLRDLDHAADITALAALQPAGRRLTAMAAGLPLPATTCQAAPARR